MFKELIIFRGHEITFFERTLQTITHLTNNGTKLKENLYSAKYYINRRKTEKYLPEKSLKITMECQYMKKLS